MPYLYGGMRNIQENIFCGIYVADYETWEEELM